MFAWRHNTITMERRSIDGSFRWFFCVSAPENHVRNKMIYGLLLITKFVVTRGVIYQKCSLVTASLVTIIGESPHAWPQTSLLMAAHTLFYIQYFRKSRFSLLPIGVACWAHSRWRQNEKSNKSTEIIFKNYIHFLTRTWCQKQMLSQSWTDTAMEFVVKNPNPPK